jgi:MoxR-like ATPase
MVEKFGGEFGKKEAYGKMLEKRGLERHEEIRKWAEEEISSEEIRKRIKEIIIKGGLSEYEIEKEEPEKVLQERIETLEEEILKFATKEEIERLKTESFGRLREFMKERKNAVKAVSELYQILEELRGQYQNEVLESKKQSLIQLIDECSQYIEKLEEKIEKDLPFRNPESFLAHSLLKLREYKEQLPSGIVETEYPKTQKERAKEILTNNRLAAFLGETGTGKTRVARKIAEEMTGEYEFVPGHRFITAEDLFYYRGLDVRKIEPSEVPEIIRAEIERFREDHPDLPEEEIKKYEQIITDVIKGQAASKELTTEVFLSAVLRAAQEGKIVIIDEFNYIPPALLGGLNALIEAKPDEEISVFGQKIKVKSGFGVIFTGNITRSEFQGRYLQREKIDPALVNRLNSGLIEYGSLPQANNLAFQESILSEKEFKEGKEIPKRELFEIGLTILADEKGNISGPKDLLEKTWNLASEISLLQKLYAGEKLETPVKLASGQDVVLKEYAISNRTFRSILESWKNDNFRYSIDWYLYDNLIRPASVISPSETGQIFLLLKERGWFFQDKSWEVLKVESSTYRIEGIEEIERNRKKFLETQRLKGPIHYFTPKEVAEALLGIKMPELEEIERVKKEKIDKEKMEKYVELKEKYEKLKAFIENWGETVELYCQDEANILGEE